MVLWHRGVGFVICGYGVDPERRPGKEADRIMSNEKERTYEEMTEPELRALARAAYGTAINVDLLSRESLIQKLKYWDEWVANQRAKGEIQ